MPSQLYLLSSMPKSTSLSRRENVPHDIAFRLQNIIDYSITRRARRHPPRKRPLTSQIHLPSRKSTHPPYMHCGQTAGPRSHLTGGKARPSPKFESKSLAHSSSTPLVGHHTPNLPLPLTPPPSAHDSPVSSTRPSPSSPPTSCEYRQARTETKQNTPVYAG